MHVASRLPVLLLLAVAAGQLVLWASADLDAWLGGGFGMFSTAERRHVLVSRLPDGAPVPIPDALVDLAERTGALPLPARLEELAHRLGKLEGLGAVRVEVWSTLPRGAALRPRAQLVRAAEASVR